MALLSVQNLEMRFGEKLIQRDVSFEVQAGSIFAVMGGSGCGKSTLLRHLVGLLPPASGAVLHGGVDYWAATDAERETMRLKFGMLFQSAALWSSMTVLENVCLALARQTALDEAAQEARAREVLEWVGMADAADKLPASLSGGMKKRAGLARAIASEPPLLFLDEPSAGLDPISSRRLDDLILDIRERTGAAVVFVSHELPSLFAIADDGIFLDADSKQPIAHGRPSELVKARVHPTVDAFLRREAPPDPPAPPARGDSA
ncbi:ATP-binding cassette domain-containing protein [uncultured Hydrogenophaga sp.]|jgi:phospholipid/cholesterol/gamma-HCH transport system ATP-binding protein|uniref:ABC transporter ATP-binding protein n=1 Tax=uncultured Hydrogenophaga sp. TaxID=199683 RepID=UPI00258D9EAE|nr:ATP-binding cassette domain-containing protein [uncultured Hydrogenophaga sp.]